MKTVKTWGKKVSVKPSAPVVTNERQPPEHESNETTQHGNGQATQNEGEPQRQNVGETRRQKRRYLTSRSRGALARLVYENMSDREAGTTVSHDIAGMPSLKKAMFDNQYLPNRELYSPRQLSILLKHYKQ